MPELKDFCKEKYNSANSYHGLVFDAEEVTKWEAKGYSIDVAWSKPYWLEGTDEVRWRDNGSKIFTLNRQTLVLNNFQCKVSSVTEILEKLEEVIEDAKKKNKI